MTIEPDTILCGHALAILKEMPGGLVDCIITSPPYWGLRDYQLEPIVWDAKEGCEHVWQGKDSIATDNSKHSGKKWKAEGFKHGFRNSTHYIDQPLFKPSTQFCSLCGAWRGSLGLEPTHGLYLDHLMQIMAECKRVMKPTATMFVNLGDSYGGSGVNDGRTNSGLQKTELREKLSLRPSTKLIPKSLIGIPERFAIRMTDELKMVRRNTIIWWKRNCMPSSAKDRFTVDFEPIYFFTKQGDYWFKQQFEDSKWFNECWSKKGSGPGTPYEENNPRKKWGNTKHEIATNRANASYGDPLHVKPISENGKRNMRTVWDIPTESSSEPHFAQFPQTLVEPMLDAGCPPGGICLDPFSGMATVASVAIRQGKHFIMIEASPKYVELSQKRIALERQQLKLEFPA